MDKYIYSAKSGIHILDLRITYEAIEKSQDYIQKLVANSGKEMAQYFSRALLQDLNSIEIDKDSLDKLDPFRDGRSLSRIQGILLNT